MKAFQDTDYDLQADDCLKIEVNSISEALAILSDKRAVIEDFDYFWFIHYFPAKK